MTMISSSGKNSLQRRSESLCVVSMINPRHSWHDISHRLHVGCCRAGWTLPRISFILFDFPTRARKEKKRQTTESYNNPWTALPFHSITLISVESTDIWYIAVFRFLICFFFCFFYRLFCGGAEVFTDSQHVPVRRHRWLPDRRWDKHR